MTRRGNGRLAGRRVRVISTTAPLGQARLQSRRVEPLHGGSGPRFCPGASISTFSFFVLAGCGLAADGRRWPHARVREVDCDADERPVLRTLYTILYTPWRPGAPNVRYEYWPLWAAVFNLPVRPADTGRGQSS